MAKKPKEKLTANDFLSTGSTLLNCAITGHPERGFAKGKYYFLVGDSTSGKTFLSLTCLAEAARNENFKDHRFIYDNAEDGALMDIEKFFGKKVFQRMAEPKNGCSTSIEEFYYNIDDTIKAGKPFIYILDSMDSLTSESEQDKFDETKTAHRKGKTTTGSYGDGKAKKNSSGIRRLLGPLRDSGSILLVLNQTRDNLGFGFEKKSRSGGHALRFYATVEMWSSLIGKIKKTVKGKPRQLGINSLVKLKKNRITGREREVTIPIYHSTGIDDIGSCVDYLIEEGHWINKSPKNTKKKTEKRHKKKSKGIYAEEFDFTGTREKLIQMIEEESCEFDLREIVGEVWNEIEEACKIKRKKRYD